MRPHPGPGRGLTQVFRDRGRRCGTPPGDVVVPKRYYPAFTQADLDATCRVRGITRLMVIGQHTDCCRYTSYDAFPRGIQPIAVTDAAVHEAFADTLNDHALNHRATLTAVLRGLGIKIKWPGNGADGGVLGA